MCAKIMYFRNIYTHVEKYKYRYVYYNIVYNRKHITVYKSNNKIPVGNWLSKFNLFYKNKRPICTNMKECPKSKQVAEQYE